MPSGDRNVLKPLLELHPAGVVVRQVRSAEDVVQIEADCKYPPAGITEPATVRRILEHVGEPTSAPAIAPARSPPMETKIVQRLVAPESVFEAIPELEFDQTANWRAEAGHDRLLHNAGVDAEPIVTRIKSLRTPNKSGLSPEVNGWLGLVQSST